MVSQLGTVGAGPRLLFEVGREMATRPDVDVHVARYEGCEVAEEVDALGLPSCVAPTDPASAPARIVANLCYAARLARHVRRHQVDAVVVVMGSPRQILPALALRLAGPTVLGGRHDPTPHEGEAMRLLVAAHMFLQRHSSHGLLTYSRATAEQVRREVSHPERVYQTVIAAFGDGGVVRPPRPDGASLLVGFFGRIQEYKGLERLAEAVRLLRADGLAVNLRVDGRGTVDAGLRAALADVGAEVNDQWVDDADVEAVVGSYDVLALPYTAASQSGVVGYAMRLGVPVVATPLPGLVEQVDGPGVGLVAADMTPAAFATSLRLLAEDVDLYRRCSDSGLAAAAGDHGWPRVVDDILSAVRSLEGHRRVGSGAMRTCARGLRRRCHDVLLPGARRVRPDVVSSREAER